MASLGAAFAFGILWVRDPLPLSLPDGASEAPPGSRPVSRASGSSAPPAESIRHRVRPPRYTGREPWEGRGLGMTVPAHSDVAWRVEVSEPVDRVSLETPETPEKRAAFRREGTGQWVFQRRIHRETEVRLRIVARDGAARTGSWTLVGVIPDRSPTARIVRPSGPTVRDPAAPGSLVVQAVVGDDYGVQEAVLVGVLTAERASGEDREHRWPLRDVDRDSREEDGGRIMEAVVDLESVAPSAGSRLRLRVEVVDNRVPGPQKTRSDARIVRFEPRE